MLHLNRARVGHYMNHTDHPHDDLDADRQRTLAVIDAMQRLEHAQDVLQAAVISLDVGHVRAAQAAVRAAATALDGYRIPM